MSDVLVVFGTRPEAVKMCPLVKALDRQEGIDVRVCSTGQHREMLAQVLEAFRVVPDYDLNIMRTSQTLDDITVGVLKELGGILDRDRPDAVLVHGDTTTSFAAALAAFYREIPVGHVEAGLRTYDIRAPYPEEFNRQAVDVVCDYLFAPTQGAADNLIAAGKTPSDVYVTGNTGIDALATTVREGYGHPVLDWARGSRLVLVTAHRRESLGETMRGMFSAIRTVVESYPDVKVVYPVHLNPVVREAARSVLSGCDRVRLVDPMDVVDFHNVLARCYFVLTDSGGIQEEAAALDKPVLVMRDVTERPEGLEAGTLKLAGTDPARIVSECATLLDDRAEYEAMAAAPNPYGDGHACERIASILAERLGAMR